MAIGNGTASRETDRLAADLVTRCPGLIKVVVSEAGASVYSASAYASGELPDLDVSIRGAVSIARRLQDPLAELVKIDPKSIGVGQYQHDVAESVLARSVDAVVEDCVNAVGVEVNTASVPLLARVSGISGTLAENIVAASGHQRPVPLSPGAEERRPARTEGLRAVRRVPADRATATIRWTAPACTRRRTRWCGRSWPRTGGRVGDLIGNTAVLRALSPAAFIDDTFGLPTVTDILAELEKPGRDPRPAFTTATFADGVEKIADLRVGMVLEGVVTNVAAFGAFVDVGVHQDGLVHVSAMSSKFVSDPRRGGDLRPGGQGQGDGGRRGAQADLADACGWTTSPAPRLGAPAEGQRTGQGRRSGAGRPAGRPAAGEATRTAPERPTARPAAAMAAGGLAADGRALGTPESPRRSCDHARPAPTTSGVPPAGKSAPIGLPGAAPHTARWRHAGRSWP